MITGMSVGGTAAERRRGTIAALLVCAVLGGLGTALALLSAPAAVVAPFAFPALLLVPLYVAASHWTIDFEIRKHSYSTVLAQIPVVVGALVVGPALHLTYRLLAALIYACYRRQPPVKVAYNLASAAFDVGAVVLAVSLAPGHGHPGPVVWLAVYAALIASEIITSGALHLVFHLLRLGVSWRDLRDQLAGALVSSTVFTGLAVVTVLALWTEPASGGLIAALAGLLGLAYRGHRRLTAQQRQTEQLYEFVKELGPLDVPSAELTRVLEQVRELLQSTHLELAVARPNGSWEHVDVSDAGGGATPRDPEFAARVARRGTPVLHTRQVGDPDRMATPLVGTGGLLGVLT
ncbi:MAG: putative Diguanylate cyclase/phosphodiesterase, partial [Frankiales bacterium]|nr:putative Diguanylate cyclase/phosphodiesterase [Frankiales bacterium]